MLPRSGYPEAEPVEPSPGFAAGDRGDGRLLGQKAGNGAGVEMHCEKRVDKLSIRMYNTVQKEVSDENSELH